MKNISKVWYSHKFKGPGVKYEIGLSIRGGDIVWVNGPYPCGMYPDEEIMKLGLLHFLEKDERVEADGGYIGLDPMYCKTPYKMAMTSEETYKRKVVLARHETVNKRLKQWGALARVFRHAVEKHGSFFRAIVVLTQLSIESGEH